MQIKRFTIDLLIGFAPALLILVPAFAVGRLLAPPYNLIGWTAILAIASIPLLRRQARIRVSARRTRNPSSHHA